jgi:hypothetical protein
MSRPANVDEEDWAKLQSELGRISASGAGAGGITPAQLAAARPEDLGNDANLELLWAEKAGKHAEAYFGVLEVMKEKKKIKLTQ